MAPESYLYETGVPWLDSLADDVVLVAIDIVDFRTINDRFGLPIGDAALTVVGRRLLAVAGESPAFRFGGDDFHVYLRTRDAVSINMFRASVRNALEEPMDLAHESGPVRIDLRVRIAVAVSRPNDTLRDLIVRADPYAADRQVDMTLAARARGVEMHPLPCGHVRSAVGAVDTTHGGLDQLCLGCILACASDSPIKSVAELLDIDVIQVARTVRIYPSCYVDPVICECRCDHAAWTPCRTAAIRDDRLLCPDCVTHAVESGQEIA